jgi:two-component system, NtrC family, nitrogen regulation response regulator NtrX
MSKILVIDDEKPIRDALHNILTAEQYHVDIVENGKKGLELLNENN